MSAKVCDYCDTDLADGSRWVGSAKVDLCSDCGLYLAKNPKARREFASALSDSRLGVSSG